MIIDLHRFIEAERPYWDELEQVLVRLERQSGLRLDLTEIARFHYLYERVSSSMARLSTFSAEAETRRYLESLVARAYAEIHETREKPYRLRPLRWLFVTFPRTFRRHRRAFGVAVAVTLLGSIFGALAIGLDPSAKEVLMPFEHLLGSPRERVQQEERVEGDHLAGRKARGAAFYIQHNTSIAIATMALGGTWGIGTVLLLFTNGIMIGAVAVDYVLAGETVFLIGWLLPHGSTEIPAILVAGQAGLVFAGALIGWGTGMPWRSRLRKITPDLVTLISGVALLLAWAGIVEAFLSQYHEPALPYSFKIAFGMGELVLLCSYLIWSGRKRK